MKESKEPEQKANKMDITLDEQIRAIKTMVEFCETINDTKTMKQAEAILATLEKAKENEWISVEDRLPEAGKRVIIEGGMGYQMSGLWYSIVDEGNRNPLSVKWKVTHWRPLPTFENKQTDKLKGE